MIITKIARTYSRSVNTKSFHPNAPESWVKVVADYEAQVESTDNAAEVSSKLYDLARSDVTAGIKILADQINQAFNKQPAAAGVAPAQPVQPANPANAVATPNAAPRQL